MYITYNKQYDFVTTNHQLEAVYVQFANGKIKVADFLEMNKGQHYGGHFINKAQNAGLIPNEYRDRTIRALAVPNAFRGKAMANFLQTASYDERDYAVELIKNDYDTLAELIKCRVVNPERLVTLIQTLDSKQESFQEVQSAVVEYLAQGHVPANNSANPLQRLAIIEHLANDIDAMIYLAEKDALYSNEIDKVYDLCHEAIFKGARKNLKKLFFVCNYFKDQVTDDELETLADKIVTKGDIGLAKQMLNWDVVSDDTKGKLEGMLVAAKLMGKKAK